MWLWLTPGLNHHWYNLLTANEVAVILPGNHSTEPHDIILQLHSGPLHHISNLHPVYTPLQYPLLFPWGENGWYPEMKLLETAEQQGDQLQQQEGQWQQQCNRGLEVQAGNLPQSRRLTLMQYVAHQIHYHPDKFNPLLHGGCLFTHYVVDMFASVDQQRLWWIEMNQPLFHQETLTLLWLSLAVFRSLWLSLLMIGCTLESKIL